MIGLMLTIRLSPDELEKLDRMAKLSRVDRAQYVESLVRQGLKNPQK